jgi:ornithine--oxo-acid transaminase
VAVTVSYERCLGSELFTNDSRRILDFLSGYCIYDTGYNHPDIIQALTDEREKFHSALL